MPKPSQFKDILLFKGWPRSPFDLNLLTNIWAKLGFLEAHPLRKTAIVVNIHVLDCIFFI